MKRKGFTIIELLAVIVILSVIVLITTPLILNVVETANEKASISSAYGYIDALEKYIAVQEIANKENKIKTNLTYKVEEETEYEVEEASKEVYLNNILKIKGNYPSDGYVKLEEGKIKYAEFTINKYMIECKENGICEVIGKKDGKVIEAESIEIKNIEEKIKVGEEIQLSATILPENTTDKKIKWVSSNENVATVDSNGLVKGISAGKTTITAISKNNNNIKDEINLTITGELVIDLQKVEFTGETEYVENNTTDGGIILNSVSSWAGKRIYMDKSYYEGFNKIEITYSFTPGYEYAMGECLSDDTCTNLKYGGNYQSVSKTTITLNLSDNNKNIYFTSSSLNAKLYIYSIKFIND